MYRKTTQNWSKHLDFIILDIICLNISFVIAYIIRHGLSNPYQNRIYMNMCVVITLLDIIIMLVFDTFQHVMQRGYYKEFTLTVKQVCLIELMAAFYLFTIRAGVEYSRTVLYIMGGIQIILSYTARVLWKRRQAKKSRGRGGRSLLIVTVDTMVDKVVENINQNNYATFYMAGVAVINRNMVGCKVDGVEIVANQETVVEYICRQWVDEVFVNIPEDLPYPWELIDRFTEMGVTVHIKLDKSSKLLGKKQFVEKLGNYTVLTSSINYASTKQLVIKRMMDICGGLVGCLITAVIFLFVAPIIYIQSPGPIFFKQVRVGKNGKKFKMYKFRSMYMDAEERKQELMEKNRVSDGMMFKLDWDPRIIGNRELTDGTKKTGIGEFIRRTSLDEWPQFFNVLKGDMSLVGTRPPTLDEWEKYQLHHRVRLAIKPGITGMWQVSGRSGITDFEEVVKLDSKYISEWSMGLDIRILIKTVIVIFKKEGAL